MLESHVEPQATQNIAILGHIILQNDILHDIVTEMYGSTGNAVLEERLKHFDEEISATGGIR